MQSHDKGSYAACVELAAFTASPEDEPAGLWRPASSPLPPHHDLGALNM